MNLNHWKDWCMQYTWRKNYILKKQILKGIYINKCMPQIWENLKAVWIDIKKQRDTRLHLLLDLNIENLKILQKIRSPYLMIKSKRMPKIAHKINHKKEERLNTRKKTFYKRMDSPKLFIQGEILQEYPQKITISMRAFIFHFLIIVILS